MIEFVSFLRNNIFASWEATGRKVRKKCPQKMFAKKRPKRKVRINSPQKNPQKMSAKMPTPKKFGMKIMKIK
ncbi:unnamed protein product [Meloidogyne enterolobii]|uniref:Uncharacterized protein n=1 Tax=Meloidogyne enterolobii TaxID=390850 RepID=A0ACB1AID3_MELEN